MGVILVVGDLVFVGFDVVDFAESIVTSVAVVLTESFAGVLSIFAAALRGFSLYDGT